MQILHDHPPVSGFKRLKILSKLYGTTNCPSAHYCWFCIPIILDYVWPVIVGSCPIAITILHHSLIFHNVYCLNPIESQFCCLHLMENNPCLFVQWAPTLGQQHLMALQRSDSMRSVISVRVSFWGQWLHLFRQTLKYIYIHIRIYICTYVHMYICICISISIRTSISISIYIHLYVYLYTYIYVYI